MDEKHLKRICALINRGGTFISEISIAQNQFWWSKKESTTTTAVATTNWKSKFPFLTNSVMKTILKNCFEKQQSNKRHCKLNQNLIEMHVFVNCVYSAALFLWGLREVLDLITVCILLYHCHHQIFWCHGQNLLYA